MKTKFLTSCMFAVSTLAMSTMAQADMLGLYASADYWDLGGDYSESASRYAANNHDLDLDDKGVGQFAVSFEHPIPLIPNARIRYTGIEAETEKQDSANNPVYEINLDNTDFILYYEILDLIVSADIGIAAKNLDGDVVYNNATASSKLDISETAAMLYGAVGADLPFTGLSVRGEVLTTSYGDIQITDALAEIKYDFIDGLLLDVGAKVGYRVLDIQLDDQDDIDTDFNFNGPYFGLEMHF